MVESDKGVYFGSICLQHGEWLFWPSIQKPLWSIDELEGIKITMESIALRSAPFTCHEEE
jgi:hypothetical protein